MTALPADSASDAPEEELQQPSPPLLILSTPTPCAKNSKEKVEVPGVYFDAGYLILATHRYGGEIHFLRIASGTMGHAASDASFLSEFRPASPRIAPAVLALNLLGRVIEGKFASSTRTYRRLITMATDPQQLATLSERALAREYNRLCKPDSPLTRVSPAAKARVIKEITRRLGEEQALLSGSEESTEAAPENEDPAAALGGTEIINKVPSITSTEDDQQQPQPTQAANPTTKGVGIMATKKGSKKKLSGAAKAKHVEKKGRSSTVAPAPKGTPNPYREGSKKRDAFSIYCEGGERSVLIEKIKKLGVTDASAASWLFFFGKVVSTGKEPGWDAPRASKVKETPKKKKSVPAAAA